MGGDVYDVFLSYAHSDSAAAAELHAWLVARGVNTFFDRNKLEPGFPWVTALEKAIASSKAVAILVGPCGIGNFQQYERQLALVRQSRDKTFPVIPVLMPGCESPPTGFLELQTWVAFARGTGVLQQAHVLETLRAALRGEEIARSDIPVSICPYRGLEPFREEDAAFFCGREGAIAELVKRVRNYPCVAVFGASGSGKSSLVFAGLLPKLREDRPTVWDVVTIRPGKWPLRSLAEAFAAPPKDAGPAGIHNYFEGEAKEYRSGDADMLAGIVDRRLDGAPENPDCLLIYVDQWEELYAMAPSAEEDRERAAQHAADVEKFITLLHVASKRSRAKVVLTVRADFYARLIDNRAIGPLLPAQQVNIPAMTPEDLRAVVEKPAARARLTFDPPNLIDQILTDLGAQEGRLPLLQFALKGIWEKRNGDRLTGNAYAAVGRIDGAIQTAAQAAYNMLTLEQQDAARRLFMSLVTPGEGHEDTRARALMPEDSGQREIVDLFSSPKTRLLVTGFVRQQGAGRDGDARATVEVAHEALIQRWGTLKAWVDANRGKLRARTAIRRALAEWEQQDKSDDYLLPAGVQLARSSDLVKDPGDVRIDDIRDFVDRSIKKEEDRLQAERDKALADERRNAGAIRALADALNNDLVFDPGTWTPRTRNALWRLAVADEAVKGDYVAILAGSPGETVRAAPGFAQISRALGLLRPSPDEAKRLVAAAISAQSTSKGFSRNESVAAEIGALAPKLTGAQAAQALDQVLNEFGKTDDPNALRALAKAIQVLPVKLTDAQVSLTLDPIFNQFLETDNSLALQALAEAIQALPVKLTDAQAGQTTDKVLSQIRKTHNADALHALARAIQALLVKLADAQAAQALDQVLNEIGKTTDRLALRALARAIEALAVKLTTEHAAQALDQVLNEFGETDDPNVLRALAKAIQALPVKLTDAQAAQAVDKVLNKICEKTDYGTSPVLGEAIEALAPKLTDAQASQALDAILKQIGQTTAPHAEALTTLAPKPTDAQMGQARDKVLSEIGQTIYLSALQALVTAIQALPVKLTDAQAGQALDPILKQIGQTTNANALEALAKAITTLSVKLTDAQASRALDPILQQFHKTDEPSALRTLAEAIQALPVKLADAEADLALSRVLAKIRQEACDEFADMLLPWAIRALSAKFTEAQSGGALFRVLDEISQRTDSSRFAEAIPTLAAKLTDAQARQALDPILTMNFGHAIKELAQAILALAPKLTSEQAHKASEPAKVALAWAGSEEEAEGWARALVALLDRAGDPDRTQKLAAAVAYPAAAGTATDVLLDAIRAGHSDAPAKEKGTEAVLEWLVKTYPDVLRPLCPQPLRPDLK